MSLYLEKSNSVLFSGWFFQRNIWKGYSFDGRPERVPSAYTRVPLLMDAMKMLGQAQEVNGVWTMPDHSLHAMAQMLPTLTDLRRLFPDEERYQQRTLSTWLSFFTGSGIRTNTKEEQQRVIESKWWEMRDELDDMRALYRESYEEE